MVTDDQLIEGLQQCKNLGALPQVPGIVAIYIEVNFSICAGIMHDAQHSFCGSYMQLRQKSCCMSGPRRKWGCSGNGTEAHL